MLSVDCGCEKVACGGSVWFQVFFVRSMVFQFWRGFSLFSPLPTLSGYMLDVSLLRDSIAPLSLFDLWNLIVCRSEVVLQGSKIAT